MVAPVLEHAAYIFASDAGHCRQIALVDLLPNENAPAANVLAERLGQAQQCPRHAPFH
jgi:hypothetical protein